MSSCMNNVIQASRVSSDQSHQQLSTNSEMRSEIATIAATTKTYSYPQGQVFGHVASIIPEAKYRVLINDNTFVLSVADPGAYDPAALVAGTAAAQREQIVANHKRLQTDYENYIAVQQVSKNFHHL